jgi:hypothetical protein
MWRIATTWKTDYGGGDLQGCLEQKALHAELAEMMIKMFVR